MTWLAFALIAPLLWALGNFIDKYSIEQLTVGTFDYLAFSTLTAWLFVPILVLVFGFPELTIYSAVAVVLGMTLLYSFGIYANGLREGETSRLVILHMLIPVLTLGIAFLFLKQTITLTQLLAFVFVLGGAAIVSVERFSLQAFRLTAGSKWTYGAIVLWSLIFVCADWVLGHMSFGSFIVLDVVGTGLALFPMLLFPSWRNEILNGVRTAQPVKFGWFFLNNTLDLGAQMLFKKSISLAPAVGLTTVVLQIQAFYAIALGYLLTITFPNIFKEDLSVGGVGRKMVGASLLLIGIVLLV